MPYEKITNKALNNLKSSILNTMSEKGMNNTDETAQSLEIDDNKLLGSEVVFYLDQGRGPGRFPPVQTMRDWARTKLKIDESEVNSAAFLIGRKISREGTTIFNDKSKGLELDSKIDEMFEGLLEELPDEVAVQALSEVSKIDIR